MVVKIIILEREHQQGHLQSHQSRHFRIGASLLLRYSICPQIGGSQNYPGGFTCPQRKLEGVTQLQPWSSPTHLCRFHYIREMGFRNSPNRCGDNKLCHPTCSSQPSPTRVINIKSRQYVHSSSTTTITPSIFLAFHFKFLYKSAWDSWDPENHFENLMQSGNLSGKLDVWISSQEDRSVWLICIIGEARC